MPKIQIECSKCQGTGLYKGMGEKGRCAVVCYGCAGEGWATFNYKEFSGRKTRNDVDRVFRGSFGYAHGPDDVVTDDGSVIRFSEGGCTYQEWLKGVKPKPVKELYCPYNWDNQGMGNEPLGEKCRKGLPGFGRIGSCKYYLEKLKCWEEYERERYDEM